MPVLPALTLPPEIWQIIVHLLPLHGAARRTCLVTSKLLHDIVAETVFSSIVIRFGSRYCVPEVSERELSRAWDILQYIARNPSFAANIKKVVIFSFLEGSALSEQRFLIMALRQLSNLRSFTWYNRSPEISPDIVAALVESCPRLDAIQVPIPQHMHPELFRLHHLRSIHIRLFELFEDDHTSDEYEFHTLVSSNIATLRELSVWNSLFLDSIPVVWQNLTHLELLTAMATQDIAQLLQKTVCLESLTLSPATSWDTRIHEALEPNAAALPRLTSLKLLDMKISYEEGDDDDNPVEVIANFLRGRHNLRRLDLDLGCAFQTLLPLFDGFQWQELESLEVLGIVLNCAIDLNDALMMERCIPRGLTALSVSGYLNKHVYARFLETFSGFPNLTFMYIGDQLEDVLDFEDVVGTFQRLELFANANTVMDIERQGDGTVLATSKWSARKIKFRTVEDFGCEDWEWLMRHHSIADDDQY
ncbi:hypothetical protein B0H21DRAFT_885253 [Amylocystis lapponica]|nr:hypothetical protein B0H21DRAFT_885253 [Amylocystis lapponica]